jgi:NAD+ synthetase
MPSMYSSEGSVADAKALVANLGINHVVIPIEGVYKAFVQALSGTFAGTRPDVTEENVQARVRGTLLMAVSNKFGGLLLSTGNKSEVSTGYCTLYGDMAGGLDVIGDVLKTSVYRIAKWVNRNGEVIPKASLTKPPSAELRPNQTDQDTLPPYEVLDGILKQYVEEEKGVAEIVALGFPPDVVAKTVRMVDLSEYKRKQAAPVLKVTGRAFGFGRRMPMAQKYRQRVEKP